MLTKIDIPTVGCEEVITVHEGKENKTAGELIALSRPKQCEDQDGNQEPKNQDYKKMGKQQSLSGWCIESGLNFFGEEDEAGRPKNMTKPMENDYSTLEPH